MIYRYGKGPASLRDDEDCKGFSDIQVKYGLYGPTYENDLHDFSNLMIIAKTMQDYKKNLSGLPFLQLIPEQYKWRGNRSNYFLPFL
ncbi:hypothetical protein CCY01nite_15700 [Chitinophaga cymbidii]|uniref:Uncharacterized protein n=1 Tax=Chitinophaga cymbidii TaxID=1096750 RepID=A0A512RI02_9BACT|nr:hypothetical protein CCY01nite_15700 [Chitinophaga cymbidii]